ncbi:MAG: hypothetical protein AAGC57_12835 [Pseudomonadota bacterium]
MTASPDRLARLARALAAARAAEQARLAVHNAELRRLRKRATSLRHQARTAAVPANTAAAFDLLADSAWRDALREEADLCDQQAAGVSEAIRPLRQSLARLLGRERALEGLVEQARGDRNRRSEATAAERDALLHAYSRRMSGLSDASPSGPSSDGIA